MLSGTVRDLAESRYMTSVAHASFTNTVTPLQKAIRLVRGACWQFLGFSFLPFVKMVEMIQLELLP